MTDRSEAPAEQEHAELMLRGLERLRIVGLVSADEYERRRAKLLGSSTPTPATAQPFAPAVATPEPPATEQPAPKYSFRTPPAPPAPAYSFGPVPQAPEAATVQEAAPAYAFAPVQPASDPTPATRGRSRMGLVAALAIVGVLAGAAGAYLALGRTSTPAAVASASTSSSASTDDTAASTKTYKTIADFVPDAKAFVEKHRGLTWHSDVSVVGLDDAAFVAKLQGGKPVSSSSTTSGSAADTATREFRALHLLPGGVDLGRAGSTATAAGVVGFYDFKTKELYVRGTSPTPYVREVIVHELTHALQDQWFGLAKLYERNDIGGESVEAFTAVVEGDAVRIEREYVQSLPADQQQQAHDSSGGSAQQQQQLASVPSALLTLMSFPYGGGLHFDQALIDARGQSTLDAAFRSPPTTTAEILDPQRYLDDVHALSVATPSPGGAEFDRGSLGALGFLLLFANLPGGQSAAAVEASAWGGDSYVAYSSGNRSCVRDTVAGISAAAQAALDGALARWIAATPSASVSSGRLDGAGMVTFTACG